MESKSWAKFLVAGALVILAMVVVGTIIFGVPEEEPVARSYNCDVYTEQGCAKFVVADGGELEIQSGGTLDVQSGSTVGLAGGTINGNQTITGTLDVYGNVSSSTGAFTVTDSVNITGSVDADSTFNADGAATFNSTVDIDGNISSGTGAVTVTDSVNITGAVDCDSTFNADGAATFGSTLDVGGDITMENDETLSNGTDGVVQVGGFLAFTEGSVVSVSAGGTITALGSFQPITSSAAITNAVIADGSVAGQIVIIVNENAGDDIVILESGSNLEAGGDITLTGGAYDSVTLMWIGDRWVRVSFEDN